MQQFPRDHSPDSTLALLREGYTFISRRCERLGSDVFVTRLLGEQAVCMRGAEAARMFYDGEHFTRRGAMPKSVVKLLQDEGSVQQLDGAAHRHRKRMFMQLMTPAAIAELSSRLEALWLDRLTDWERAEQVVLFDEVRQLLFETACQWCHVPVRPEERERRAGYFTAMLDATGSLGPRHWQGRLRRARAERWIRQIVQQVRDGELTPPPDSPLAVIAWHQDLEGQLLDVPVAAVEVINLLRPIVAIGRFIIFAALALHRHPEWRERLSEAEDDQLLEAFVQEVRRDTPFFPVIAGRVRESFEWRGHRFEQGLRVMLDLYGTDHDPRLWPQPESFRPERFLHWQGDAYSLIPQGGGDYATGHRCPGEWITIALMKQAVRLLTSAMRYRVPEQDLSVDLTAMPTLPKSRFVLSEVRGLDQDPAPPPRAEGTRPSPRP